MAIAGTFQVPTPLASLVSTFPAAWLVSTILIAVGPLASICSLASGLYVPTPMLGLLLCPFLYPKMIVLSCPELAVSSVALIPFPITTTLSSSAVLAVGKVELPKCTLLCPFTHSPAPLPIAVLLFPATLFTKAFRP